MSTAVSVIVPVYKTPLSYFKKCLDSLASQTLDECEFLIIFDGENVEQKELSDTYQNKDSRFKSFVCSHEGVCSARNFGIHHAKGEYITFVDSDDWIEKESCAQTYAFAKEKNSDIVLFDYTPDDNQYERKVFNSKSIQQLSLEEIDNLQLQTIDLTDFKYVAAVSTWCKLIKLDFCKKNNILFDTHLTRCVDRPFCYALYNFTDKISYLNATFYHYNKVEGSISNSGFSNINLVIINYVYSILDVSEKHKTLVSKLIILNFFGSWESYYFNKENVQPFFTRIRELVSITQDPRFKAALQYSNLSDVKSKTIRIESYLLKKNIHFFIWIHALLNQIKNFHRYKSL